MLKIQNRKFKKTPPPASKQYNYGWVFLSVGILIFGIFGLLFFSTALSLTESKVSSSNLDPTPPKYLNSVVEAQSVPPKPKIISHNLPKPEFSSASVIAVDVETGEVLYEKNIHQKLSPASTTKIMTAVVASDNYDLGQVVSVPPAALVSGSSMNLSAGEQLTIRSLLYGMLLNSGNDAAYALATVYPTGFDGFINKMNEKSVLLGLKDTHFTNPAGFDDQNHYSSAYDMSMIGRYAIRNPQLTKIFSTRDTQVTSVDNARVHNLHNLNKLLGSDGVIGIKTGFTEIAGENLVGLVDRNGHQVLTVVLSSNDRFGETKTLMDWVYQNYQWQEN